MMVLLTVLFSFTESFAQHKEEKFIDNLGIKISLGYVQRFVNADNKLVTGKVHFTLPSYEALLAYKIRLYKDLALMPFVGYSGLNEFTGVGLWACNVMNVIGGGAYIGYEKKHFLPKFGFCFKRILTNNNYEKIENGGKIVKHNVAIYELKTKNTFQLSLGFDYTFKKYALGIEGWFGVNNLNYYVFASPWKINQYMISFTCYPFKKIKVK
jgi:hypothetical protein